MASMILMEGTVLTRTRLALAVWEAGSLWRQRPHKQWKFADRGADFFWEYCCKQKRRQRVYFGRKAGAYNNGITAADCSNHEHQKHHCKTGKPTKLHVPSV